MTENSQGTNCVPSVSLCLPVEIFTKPFHIISPIFFPSRNGSLNNLLYKDIKSTLHVDNKRFNLLKSNELFNAQAFVLLAKGRKKHES